MISEKTFCERLEVIKAADKQLKDSIESYFEKNNPFIETQEAIAFPAEWIYKLTENHLKTLFAAVNEKIVNKCWKFIQSKSSKSYVSTNASWNWILIKFHD